LEAYICFYTINVVGWQSRMKKDKDKIIRRSAPNVLKLGRANPEKNNTTANSVPCYL